MNARIVLHSKNICTFQTMMPHWPVHKPKRAIVNGQPNNTHVVCIEHAMAKPHTLPLRNQPRCPLGYLKERMFCSFAITTMYFQYIHVFPSLNWCFYRSNRSRFWHYVIHTNILRILCLSPPVINSSVSLPPISICIHFSPSMSDLPVNWTAFKCTGNGTLKQSKLFDIRLAYSNYRQETT